MAGPVTAVAEFEPLVERWRGPAYRLAIRFVGDPSEAEDVTQEIFVQLYRRLDSYDRQRPFEPWFWTLATNVCRNYLRRRVPVPSEMVGDRSSGAAADFDFELAEALAELQPSQRVAILLHHQLGLPIVEVARRLGLSDAAVKSRLHRARASLRLALSGAAGRHHRQARSRA